ncbi:MAG: energy-coupling factor transporter transmembrane protein EcfT [Desulfuromonadales bacterium]|nr:energy-coupling factor transporter transmembrane protein EcfT [Desulfuromonadales bacterium]
MTDQSFMLMGQFQEGDSPLHRLDPRLKFVICMILIVCAFAASDWPRFTIAVIAVCALNMSSGQGFSRLLRALWAFRWFFLFTLLLHLFMTPGHTLFGVAWLSKDGLMKGLMVCGQMGISVGAATLLASTTAPGLLARTCGWFLSPLKLVGCRVREWEGLLLLALKFIPVLREELVASVPGAEKPAAAVGSAKALHTWKARLLVVLDRLVLRADAMAHDIVAGRDHLEPHCHLEPIVPFTFTAYLYVIASLFFAALYWIISGL